MKRLTKKFREVKKLPDFLYFLLMLLAKCLVRCLYRVKVEDPRGYIQAKENFIVVIWHNRLLFMPALFPRSARKRTQAVISPSRDGQYIADFVRQFGLRTIRGSSCKQGSSAQREAVRAINAGWHVCFTPDGPRGPKYRLQRGPVHLASVTGQPIMPLMINASRYWQVKSWDNFQIPKPFSRLTLVLGEPVEIPSGISIKEELEVWCKRVEDKLMELTQD
ncbi:MAG: lysophospholipid acyltransferase family protein [Victivallaceae bacterium]|nr:lysophospholipid acyltransferase family protein [Victivallaceae bacterium]